MSDPKQYPSIAHAKELATRCRRRGVIILSFGEKDYHMASYGMTRPLCDGMRSVVEQIGDQIGSGEIDVPRGFGRTPVKDPGEVVSKQVLEVLQEGLRLGEIAVRQGLSFDAKTTDEIVREHVSLKRMREVLATLVECDS